jgi:tetratricopeptide (TPR) repeat protein
MRRTTGALWLAVLVLGLSVPTYRAQERKPAPSEESAEDEKPYTPPAAWKSVEIGDFYFKKKRYNGALSRYEEAVRTDPYYPKAFLGLGKVYEKMGLKRKALEAYQKYLDLLPSEKAALEAKDAQKAVVRLKKELKVGALPSALATSEGGRR